MQEWGGLVSFTEITTKELLFVVWLVNFLSGIQPYDGQVIILAVNKEINLVVSGTLEFSNTFGNDSSQQIPCSESSKISSTPTPELLQENILIKNSKS